MLEFRDIETDTTAAFHAVDSNISVGVVNVSKDHGTMILDKQPVSDFWYFNRLYVKPQNRGTGIAGKLLKKLVDFVERKKILLVCDINAYGDLTHGQLEHLYKKYGFEEATVSYMYTEYPTLILDRRNFS